MAAISAGASVADQPRPVIGDEWSRCASGCKCLPFIEELPPSLSTNWPSSLGEALHTLLGGSSRPYLYTCIVVDQTEFSQKLHSDIQTIESPIGSAAAGRWSLLFGLPTCPQRYRKQHKTGFAIFG